MNKKDKIRGCLFGQAIGDALGLGTEFLSKEEVHKFYPQGLSQYNQIIQDPHRRRWKIGAWTDDTDMMLCILKAFDGKQFNINHIAQNFKDWFDGNPLGIGSSTYKILCTRDYVDIPFECSRLWWEVSRGLNAPNGAVMRTSVVGCEQENVTNQAIDVCRLTHYDPRCVASCVIVSEIIHSLIWESRELTYQEIRDIGTRFDDRTNEWIYVAYKGTLDDLDIDKPREIGYTLRTLGAGLWAYFHAEDFITGLKNVINEGGDGDSNGAVAGAILGAKFGFSSIPTYYVENLYNLKEFQTETEFFIHKVLP